MAAVRSAARKLGGSLLQRAQAVATSPAVAEERRRLIPRRFLSQDANHVAARRIFAEYPESEIQQKKRELYTLISEADKQFLSETKNRQLLVHLSGHAEPRPITKVTKWLWRAGTVTWGFVAGMYYRDRVRVAELENASGCNETTIAQQKYAA